MKAKDWPTDMIKKGTSVIVSDDNGNEKEITNPDYVLAKISHVFANSYKLSHLAGVPVEHGTQVGKNYCLRHDSTEGATEVGDLVWAKIPWIKEFKNQ